MKLYVWNSSFAVVVLLSLSMANARTWRGPTVLTSTTTKTAPWNLVRGGGDDMFIPKVPQDTVRPTGASNLQNDVARGGSTSTRLYYHHHSQASTAAISRSYHTKVSPLGSISSTPSFTAAAPNTTVLEAQVDLVTPDAKSHKRHKHIAKKLKNRNATNIRRKVLHASFGFFFAALNHFIPKAQFVPGMTVLTSATLIMELLRYRKGFGWMNDILHFVLGSSLRKHEMDGKFTGSFYYFLGVTLTAALYPTSCATLGICQLAIADPTASYFGRATRHVYWSRIENGLGGIGRNKGILGFLGGALACVPMNYYLLSKAQYPIPVATSSIWLASLALGFAGAFADLAVPTPALTLPKKVCGVRVPPFHVDDNVVVPIVSGYACAKVFQLLGFPANLSLAKFLIV